MLRSWLVAGFVLLLSSAGLAQAWRTAYENGLAAARDSRWADARAAFKSAAASRPEDQSGPTALPGPVTENRRWRNGAPYSPNFLAAYAEYRLGMGSSELEQVSSHLRTAATEFETLLAKGQYSKPTFFFLINTYSKLNDKPARQKVDATYVQAGNNVNFKVDLEAVIPEDQALIAQMFEGITEANPVIKVGGTDPTVIAKPPGTGSGTTVYTPGIGRIPTVDTKYALIIGNAESKIPGSAIPFATESANVVKEALTNGAGYPESNVSVITNATAAQMLQAATALADKLPDGATVTIYFAGVGSHMDGKDYLAGVDTAMLTDSSSMLVKFELFRPFVLKGAQVFAFFETNRSVMPNGYFGAEVNQLGAISQVYATLKGDSVFSLVREGKQVGMFAEGMANVLSDLRSNRVPITEFAWQLFFKMRQGMRNGGGRQTPTLPIRTNMGADARF